MSNETLGGGAIKQIGDQLHPIYKSFTHRIFDFLASYPWSCVTGLCIFIATIGYFCLKKIDSANASRVIGVKTSLRHISISRPTGSNDSFSVDELLGVTNPDKHEDVRIKLLRSMRILGDIFEDSDLLAMARKLEFVQLKVDQVLLASGDQDDFLYVVQEGRLMVSCLDSKTSDVIPLRVVEKGDNICSLLGVMEHFVGVFPKSSATITATSESVVAKFPISALIDTVSKDSQQMLRVVQLIMMWIHRVLFLALFSFLGLRQDIFIASKLQPDLKLDQERKMNSFGGRNSFGTGGNSSGLSPSDSTEKLELLTADSDFKEALKDIVKIFQLDNVSILERKLKYIRVPAATLIVQPNEPDTPLLYVASGCLRAWTKKPDDETDETMIEVFEVNKGEMLGGLALLSGEPMLFQIETKVITKVIAIHRADFYEILPQNPQLVYGVAQTEISRLSGFIRQIDFGLVWDHVLSGQAIYRKGDEATCLFIVVAGRLRSVIEDQERSTQCVMDYCRGDLVGLVEISVNRKRQTTVVAVRDSEVVILPLHLLHAIRTSHPNVVSRLVNYLSTGIVSTLDQAAENSIADGLTRSSARPETLTTIAVVPCDSTSPLSTFAAELEVAFNNICKTIRVASEDVRKNVGSRALQPVGAARLSAWLSQKEDEYRIVLYQSDSTLTPWTLRCLRQADCVLVVGYGDEEPEFNDIGRFLSTTAEKLRGRKDLVLLHRLTNPDLSKSRLWIDSHPWISLHHHISCPDRLFHKRLARLSHSGLRPRSRSRAATMDYPHSSDKHSDFARLARILTGTAVGLVLGGGGSRGFSHVGIIESLVEEGIPIDMIGGVSMGAFVSSLWALYRDVPEVRKRCKIWAVSMGNKWNFIRELTYPYMALFSGRLYNQFVKNGVGDVAIEQLWIPYFCASTDITDVNMRVHTRGDLWRYVRASMTVVGYFPPICDPEDGHLLVDGGYMNNVPADVMRQRGAGIILAVDVGGEASRMVYNFGDEFNGWTTLKQRFWPWGKPLSVPDITELQTRLAYVRSTSILAALKQSRWCNYIRPPIASFQTLDFQAYDEIVDIGYYFGKHTFAPKGPLRLKLVEMRRQLLTTSFGLFIAHRRPQPVLGQYLTDLASYARIQGNEFGTSSDDKRQVSRFRNRADSGTLDEVPKDSAQRLSDSDLLAAPSAEVIGLKPSRSFWDEVQHTESVAKIATQSVPLRLSRVAPESFLSVPKKANNTS